MQAAIAYVPFTNFGHVSRLKNVRRKDMRTPVYCQFQVWTNSRQTPGTSYHEKVFCVYFPMGMAQGGLKVRKLGIWLSNGGAFLQHVLACHNLFV